MDDTITEPAGLLDGAPELERVDDVTVRMPTGELVRVCGEPGCEETFIINPRGFGANRKYCDAHLSTGGGRNQPKRRPAGTQRDRAPRSANVRVTLGGPAPRRSGKDGELAAIEERLRQFVSIGAGVLAMAGGEHGPADAEDLNRGKAEFAAAVAGLAEYYPAIRRLAAGGEMGGKVTAWVRLAVALMAMLVPILIRHGAIPENIARLLAMAEDVAPNVPRETSGAAVDESVAAA